MTWKTILVAQDGWMIQEKHEEVINVVRSSGEYYTGVDSYRGRGIRTNKESEVGNELEYKRIGFLSNPAKTIINTDMMRKEELGLAICCEINFYNH